MATPFSRSPCVASTSGRTAISTPTHSSPSRTLRCRAPAIAARPLLLSFSTRKRHRFVDVAARNDGEDENAPSSSSSSPPTPPLRRSGSDPMAEAAYEGWAFSSVPQKGGRKTNSSSSSSSPTSAASASNNNKKKKTSTAASETASEWGTQSLSDGQLVDALYEDDGSPELVAQNVLAVSLALLLAASLGGVLVRIGAVAAALVVAAVRYSVVAVLLLLIAVVLTPKR